MIKPPRSVHNARDQRQLVIRWQNGTEHSIPYTQLRAACRCAGCRAQHASGNIQLVAADISIEKINNLGQGLQLVFSDGHERGIFPWQYLFDLGHAI